MTARAAIALVASTIAIAVACASARVAAADPVSDRVWTAPTAWLPAADSVIAGASASAGGNDLGNRAIDVGYGLGGLASLTLDVDGDLHCATCSGTTPSPVYVARAAFRIGARQDLWFEGQPALVLGVRHSFAADDGVQVADAYVVASRTAGGLVFHAGAAALSASATGRTGLPATIRPFGGVEWTPPQYPKTALVADVMWQPELLASSIDTQWLGGLGVRYQALRWAAISLSVRTRGHGETTEGLDTTAVIIRIDGVWSR